MKYAWFTAKKMYNSGVESSKKVQANKCSQGRAK
jgi:hypothetical protein